jgi:hypothetical protein
VRIQELIERIELDADRIPNPLGEPPEDVEEVMNAFWDIELEIWEALHGNGKSDGKSFEQKAKETAAAISHLGTKATLPISTLIPFEAGVDPTHVQDAYKNTNLPTVYLYQGKYYINDGNHRIASHKLRGATSVVVNVVNTNDILAAAERMAT